MFEVGDIVRIKDKFWKCKPTVPLGITDVMQSMQGEIYKVKKNQINGYITRYRLDVEIKPDTAWDENKDWVWDENWLEPVVEIKEIYTEELDLILKG